MGSFGVTVLLVLLAGAYLAIAVSMLDLLFGSNVVLSVARASSALTAAVSTALKPGLERIAAAFRKP